MEFSRLNGDLDMDSGDMRASDLMGPFRLLTRSKDVRLTGVNGDVRLENENGAVEIHMNKLGNMQVSNRNSDVQIYLPDKAALPVGRPLSRRRNRIRLRRPEDRQRRRPGNCQRRGRRRRSAPGHQQRARRNRTAQRIDGSGGASATPSAPPHVPAPPKVPVPTEN